MANSNSLGVVGRTSALYYSSQWYDLEFHLIEETQGKKVVLRAHRLILASASPVFEALCFGPMAEKTAIQVPDIIPEAFEAMLKYLYTDCIEFKTVDIALNILYAAKKYIISDLVALSAAFLSENMCDNNCVDVYNLSNVVEEKDLMGKSFDYICRRINYVKSHLTRDNTSPELLCKLSKSQNLNCEEVELLVIVQSWAKKECETMGLLVTDTNVRNLLIQNDIFKNIRWNALSDQDLSNVMPGLLTDDELATRGRLESRRFHCPVKYAYIHRYLVDMAYRKNLRSDNLSVSSVIKVNKSVILNSLFISAKSSPMMVPQQPFLTYLERMSILVSKDEQILLRQDVKQNVQYGSPFVVNLVQPVPLEEDVAYKITIQLQNPVKDYPFGALSTITKIPSGLCVACVQSADIQSPGTFEQAFDLSLITGFQFIC